VSALAACVGARSQRPMWWRASHMHCGGTVPLAFESRSDHPEDLCEICGEVYLTTE